MSGHSDDHASGVPRANQGRDALGRRTRLARSILIRISVIGRVIPNSGSAISPGNDLAKENLSMSDFEKTDKELADMVAAGLASAG
jgi:hypothetical protein